MNHILSSKKIITFFMLFILLLSLRGSSVTQNDENNVAILSQIYEGTSRISVKEKTDYATLSLTNSSSFLTEPGKPEIPIITKTFTFPLGTKIKNVSCRFSDQQIISLDKKIKPSPYPFPKTRDEHLLNHFSKSNMGENKQIYENSNPYPDKDIEYSINCGLEKGKRVLFLTIHCFPVQYRPKENIISMFEQVELHVSYTEKPWQTQITDEYDLVIITPRRFVLQLEPLVLHKNLHGINTKIKTVESIYRESAKGAYDAQGIDDAEKIKYFIKNEIEKHNITYVLLVGGHQHQKLSWFIPVRYSNLHDRSFWNDTYVTDLYYADIYKYNQSSQQIEFDDWDSNKNGIHGEWTWIFEDGWWYTQDKKDTLDLYPDVYIGRLACRDQSEVKAVVQKIIAYENKLFDHSWYKNIILAGGDTFPMSDGICEGEIVTNHAANSLEAIGFNVEKLWVSNGKLNGPIDIIKALHQGAGFIFLSGHGTPLEWCTHPVADHHTWIDVYGFQMQHTFNRNKNPICLVGGCHNSQFDVTMMNIMEGFKKYGPEYFMWNTGIDCFQKWTWAPNCWSWNLVSQKQDGFIAAIGNTGLGWGVSGENCVNYNEGYLNSHFFQVYADLSEEGFNQLGMIQAETINDYIIEFNPNNDPIDRKTIEQWVLLGDPSLKIGGYT
ncbi:MAG: C25 family cysteine peptidase [Thermoplasmatota archaeon]